MSNLDLLNKAFREHFPARGGPASLEFVEANEQGAGTYGIVMRLVVWDVNSETGVESIRDVKEQQLALKLAALDLTTIARVQQLCAALVKVLERALGTASEVEVLMPSDLVDFSPLKLAKAHTVDDFVQALSVPSRLGRYLPHPT